MMSIKKLDPLLSFHRIFHMNIIFWTVYHKATNPDVIYEQPPRISTAHFRIFFILFLLKKNIFPNFLIFLKLFLFLAI